MNWMGKTRSLGAAASAPSKKSDGGHAASTPHRDEQNFRVSNGLKDFLWLISDVQHGRLLDLGPIYQATLSFFIERGFRLTTEDILRSWMDYLSSEKERLRKTPPDEDEDLMSPSSLADRFMRTALQYSPEGFHAVLAWDIFDYLDAELVPRIASRLYELVHPGGAVLALFHSKPADRFYRYRIADSQTIEVVPVSPFGSHERVFQNREILNLFGQFRSAKTFVGRDQLREGLFIK